MHTRQPCEREWIASGLVSSRTTQAVVFGEDGFGFRAGARQVISENAREVAFGDIIQDSQGFTHNPLSARMRARAVSGESAFSG